MVDDLWKTKINGKEIEILPYGVLLEDLAELPSVYRYFQKEGFDCRYWNIHKKFLLINLNLKRYGTISNDSLIPMIGGNPMTIENFINKIYKPWKEQKGEVFVEYSYVPNPDYDIEDKSYCWKTLYKIRIISFIKFFREMGKKIDRKSKRFLICKTGEPNSNLYTRCYKEGKNYIMVDAKDKTKVFPIKDNPVYPLALCLKWDFEPVDIDFLNYLSQKY